MPGFMDSYQKSKAPPAGGSKPGLMVAVGLGKTKPEEQGGQGEPSEAEISAARAIRSASDEVSLARALKAFYMACDSSEPDGDEAAPMGMGAGPGLGK